MSTGSRTASIGDDRCARGLAPGASLAEVEAVLDRGLVAIVADASGFHGLITRVDVLNHLRRSVK
jgi:cystathionine beta-synthase